MIIVSIIMVIFIGVIIYSAATNKPEPPPEPEEPCPNTVTVAGEDYKIDSTTSLSIEWTSLTGEDMRSIALLVNLTSLELKVCEITDIRPLSGLVNLTRLDLRLNSISDLTPLSELLNLTHLDLRHNDISSVNALADLTNLVMLELGGNNISDISPLYGRLPYLKNLYIYDNAKDSRGYDYFDERLYGDIIKEQFQRATIHF